jgi:hypothetical protein
VKQNTARNMQQAAVRSGVLLGLFFDPEVRDVPSERQ